MSFEVALKEFDYEMKISNFFHETLFFDPDKIWRRRGYEKGFP